MKRGLAALLVVLVGAVGCRDQEEDEFPVTEEREPYGELATAADTAEEEFLTDETVGVITVQGGRQVPGPLTATGNVRGPTSGAPPGAVTITESDGTTELLVSLYGYEEGAELQAAFVRGPCGQPGELVQAVEPIIEVPSSGVATYETTVPIVTRTLFDGAHSIRLVSPAEISTGTAQVGDASACSNLMELE